MKNNTNFEQMDGMHKETRIALILGYHNMGYTNEEICERLSMPESTVRYYIDQYKKK